MRTELIIALQDLVLEDLNPGAEVMKSVVISYWLRRIPILRKKMEEAVSVMLFGHYLNEHFRVCMRQIQRDCTFLINTLVGYNPVAKEMKGLYNAVLSCLEQCLDHLKTRYPDFFNLDLPVPSSHFKILAATIKADMGRLITGLKNKNEDIALQQLIVDSLNKFLNAANCSYCRFDYIEGLQKSLIEICDTTDKMSLDKRLRKHLFYYNLNNAAHIEYHKNRIAASLAEEVDAAGEYYRLLEYQRMFRGWEQLQDSFYKGASEGIKSVLLRYVRTELQFRSQKRIYQGATKPVPLVNNPLVPLSNAEQIAVNTTQLVLKPEPEQNTCYKINALVSVDALAYFFKLLIMAGAVKAKPRSQLLHFVSRNFQTPGLGVKDISPLSLENKYKEVVQATANQVRALLQRMLSLLNNEFAVT
jgi:hypothetical protein